MNRLYSIFDWIKEDFNSHPLRCSLEITAWFASVGASILFMMTVPNVPFAWYLSLTVASSAVFAWCLWTRNSIGGLANYVFLVAIDAVALTRLLLH